MAAIKQLIHEIELLPEDYISEIMDFVGYLKLKSKNHIPETMLMSEHALTEYWDTPEEDAAWAYL